MKHNRGKMKSISKFAIFCIFSDCIQYVHCQCDCSLMSGNADPMFIALLVMLVVLLVAVVVLAVLVVKIRYSGSLVRRGVSFQNQNRQAYDNVTIDTDTGAEPKNKPARKRTIQSTIYAEPSNSNAEGQGSQPSINSTIESLPNGAFQYDTVKPFSVHEEQATPAGKKYGYAKVNKNKKPNDDANKKEGAPIENSLLGKQPRVESEHYADLTDGEYDKLRQRRVTLEEGTDGVYNSIDDQSTGSGSPRTLDKGNRNGKGKLTPPVKPRTQKPHQNEQEAQYDTPKINTEPCYDVPPSSLNAANETYDVPPATDTTYSIPPPTFQVFDPEETYDKPPSSSQTTQKKEVVYDRPPLIPTPFQDVYDVPKTGIRKVHESS